VLAVGGYGRAEMAPHSDVDLLFLTPWKITPWAESVIESMLYMLWDLKLKVGHASRTVKDCLRLGREDITIRTALLEHRFIAGQPLADELGDRLWAELFRNTGPEFIEAKLAERAERHRKQGGQRYVLEPNVKEGKGGLRDLQTLYWIGKYLHRVPSRRGWSPPGCSRARNTRPSPGRGPSSGRCAATCTTSPGRADRPADLRPAGRGGRARMGYARPGGRRAVEHFMQDYFRHATRVGELTRIFLTELEARHAKREAAVGLLPPPQAGRAGYKIVQGRLDVIRPAAFLADKLNLLRVFEEALRTGYLLHPNVMRLIAANLT
jgi:[protein-PII] uridylyltransferase